jgi:pilus assembly protein CpaB
MGRYRPLVLVVTAAIIALITSLLIHNYLQKRVKVRDVTLETEPVTVAKSDLSWGTKVTKEMVKTVDFLKGSLPRDTFLDPSFVVGRVLIYPVKANEPIFESRLAPTNVKAGGVAAVISPKKRAVAVKIDKTLGFPGFIRPGNRVDVLVTLASGRASSPVTKTVLENILVLTAGPSTETKGKEEKMLPVEAITLEVSPEEAEKLALAATEGRLQLALRNFNDTQDVFTPGATIPTLLTSHSRSPVKEMKKETKVVVKKEVENKKPVEQIVVPPPLAEVTKVETVKPPAYTVELIKGSKMSEVTFEGSE